MVVTSVTVGVTIVAESERLSRLPSGRIPSAAQFRFLLEFLTVSFPAPQSGGLTSLENLMSGSIDFSHHISIVDKKSRSSRICVHIVVNFHCIHALVYCAFQFLR